MEIVINDLIQIRVIPIKKCDNISYLYNLKVVCNNFPKIKSRIMENNKWIKNLKFYNKALQEIN
jgi:hypothetical protein